jgi:hypothetical protein
VLEYQVQARKHYADTLDNLSKINRTIAGVYAAIMQQKASLEDFITWAASFMGSTS